MKGLLFWGSFVDGGASSSSRGLRELGKQKRLRTISDSLGQARFLEGVGGTAVSEFG